LLRKDRERKTRWVKEREQGGGNKVKEQDESGRGERAKRRGTRRKNKTRVDEEKEQDEGG